MKIYIVALAALALAGCSSETNTANVQDVAANNMAATDDVTEVQDESAAAANDQAVRDADAAAALANSDGSALPNGRAVENNSPTQQQR